MSSYWNTVVKHLAVHAIQPGDTLHPLPTLCLLNETEFNRWSSTPGRPLTAIAIASDLRLRLDKLSTINSPTIN